LLLAVAVVVDVSSAFQANRVLRKRRSFRLWLTNSRLCSLAGVGCGIAADWTDHR
jgi:hypothetical protein